MPNMNSRQMKQAMKKMGVQQEEIAASYVLMKLQDGREIVIENPSVQKVNMMGESSYQVSGNEQLREPDSKAEISEEDVQTVVEQTNVSEEEAKKAIEEAEGDLAQAILNLNN